MRKLILALLLVPLAASAATICIEVGERFVVKDGNGNVIGPLLATFKNEPSFSGTVASPTLDDARAALVDYQVEGRRAIFVADNGGSEALFRPWTPTYYTGTSCTGTPYLPADIDGDLSIFTLYDMVSMSSKWPRELLEPTGSKLDASAIFGVELWVFTSGLCKSIQSSSASAPDYVYAASVFVADATPYMYRQVDGGDVIPPYSV